MTHFPPSEWVDFVREIALPETRARLESHLAQDCQQCREALVLWKSVAGIAKSEAISTPPEGIVRMAKASFRPEPKNANRLLAAFAELVFDSTAQPALAGVRSAAAGTRRLLYRSGQHSVDLSIEQMSDSRVTLIGQILDSAARTAEAGVQVSLIQNNVVFATAETNQAGVFNLQCENADSMELELKLGGGEKELVLTVTPGKLGWRE